ncbi:MAG: hypothetical protein EBY49_09195 [Actinobacteria bacterium]|nr:hypothetical protein [Actinomycetota bacterium]
MKVGFIGLGNVGGKLAGSLLRNGYDLMVRDLDREVAQPFVDAGARFAESPRDMAEQCDLVITCLPSPAASAAVMEADDGLLAGFGPGWGSVKVTAVLAAASMAGVPPLLGFIAKEKALLSAIDGHFIGAWWVVAAIVAGSVLTFAYSARFVLGVFGRLADASAADADHPT